MEAIEIGRLLRAGTAGFVFGCRVSQLDAPALGSLVRAPLGSEYQVYGLIHDIHIDDDGLVRQLVTADTVDEAVIADNRINRNIPVEISVLVVGYQENGRVRHILPPRPPLSLDLIFLCSPAEVREFTDSGQFGYFRHILRGDTYPVEEILATHLLQAQSAHTEAGDGTWQDRALQELITILRDDYPRLMGVLGAASDALAR
ncbi:MAG: hypothetical protein R3335_07655 [Anaerolineales bacterium]|nr:hypothetical protein [Anaerolineales bacterium]